MTMPALEIQSVGAPPEKHADRVVAEMMRHLAKQHAEMWDTIKSAAHGPFVRDGNPRAQRKLAEKVKAAGAKYVHLEPGKRGKYRLSV
jgi:hypothetical protein